jgi:prepilin-type processing-associated H-X9-DG protein
MLDNNSAEGNVPPDWKANGVFLNRYIYPNNPSPPPTSPAWPATVNDGQGNGSFNLGPLDRVTQAYVSNHDGASNTAMLSEQIYNRGNARFGNFWAKASPSQISGTETAGTEMANGFVFWPTRRPNELMLVDSDVGTGASLSGTEQDYLIRPASYHMFGVNVAMCDGSARFVHSTVDYQVWCLLMTPDGKNCNTPGFAPGFDMGGGNAFYYPGGDNYQYLRTTSFDPSMLP